jgi:hypothetical protein
MKSYWGRDKCDRCGRPSTSVTGVCAECRTTKCPNPWNLRTCSKTFVSPKPDVTMCEACRRAAKRRLKSGALTLGELRKINKSVNGNVEVRSHAYSRGFEQSESEARV